MPANATATNATATPAQIAAARPDSNPHNPSMTTLRYGIEIESYHPSTSDRGVVAKRIAEVMGDGWTTRYEGGYYDKYNVVMPDGRKWTVMSDASIVGGLSCEVVSPILTWSDMDTLQQIVRAMRKAGLRVNASTGIHVHVDGAAFKANPRKLVNLIKLVDKREELIHDMIGGERRGSRWCRTLNTAFADAAKGCTTEEGLRAAWYRTNGDAYEPVNRRVRDHYDDSRYHGLNLHSLFFRGTVEFRYFDCAKLHAGKIRSYVCLVLALAGKALDSKSIRGGSCRTGVTGARNVLYHELGLRSDYFANVRDHLLAPIVAAGTATATRGRNLTTARSANSPYAAA